MKKDEKKKDMAERRFSEDEPVMVSIRCITYNHALYIRQCLDGFVMQKTNFRFQAVVHDDASTDGTTEIVREYAEKYPDIIIPMYEEENRWSKHDGSLLSIMLPLMKGKYWAECEGDDFWTDPNKLQKQVDIMEANPNISMVFTAFNTVNEAGLLVYNKIYKGYQSFSRSGNILPRLMWRNHILTVSICMKRELVDSVVYTHAPVNIDYLTFLTAASHGECFYVTEETCSYRINTTGSVATRSEYITNSLDKLRVYFSSLYIDKQIGINDGRKKRALVLSIIWTVAFHHKQLFRDMVKKNLKSVLLIPFAFCIKAIDFIGVRIFSSCYNPFSLYNFWEKILYF